MIAARLAEGFDRIDDFLAVQGPLIPLEAVECLQEAVDLGEPERAVIAGRVAALREAGHSAEAASVLLGVLVALLAGHRDAGSPVGSQEGEE